MPSRTSAASVRDLVRKLASVDRSKVAMAKARLTILGGRSVEALIATLEGGDNRLKLHAMPMLALIRDPRACEPLIALLKDRDPKIREGACRALGRFACRESIICLERLVKFEPRLEVRLAAIQALASLFEDGHEEALREILGALFDSRESHRVRQEALRVLSGLSARERRAILKRLRNDPDQEIALRAQELEHERGRVEAHAPVDLAQLTTDLASRNHARWNEALHRLIAAGSAAIPSLLSAMRARDRDPEFASRAAMVLKGLGPRRLKGIASHLDSVSEPLALEVLVDAIATVEDRPLTYRLRDLISTLDERSARLDRGVGFDPYARVRGKAHLALARLGSRVAIDDLRRTLVDPARRLDPDLLAAVGRVGTRQELPDLLRAYVREDAWMRGKIREAFWQVVRREKIRKGKIRFPSLSVADRRALREILSASDSRRSGSPWLPGMEGFRRSGGRAAHRAGPARPAPKPRRRREAP